MLRGTRFVQDCVKRGHDRYVQVPKQRQHVGTRGSAVDAVLVLHGDDVCLTEVQEIRCPPVRIPFFLEDLEPNFGSIVIRLAGVRDGDHDPFRGSIAKGDGLGQVRGERRDATLAWAVASDEGELVEFCS